MKYKHLGLKKMDKIDPYFPEGFWTMYCVFIDKSHLHEKTIEDKAMKFDMYMFGWFIMFYGVSTLFRSLNTKLNSKQFSLVQVCSLNAKTDLFQATQFSKSSQFSSI